MPANNNLKTSHSVRVKRGLSKAKKWANKERGKKITDKIRLDWLDENGIDIMHFDDSKSWRKGIDKEIRRFEIQKRGEK